MLVAGPSDDHQGEPEGGVDKTDLDPPADDAGEGEEPTSAPATLASDDEDGERVVAEDSFNSCSKDLEFRLLVPPSLEVSLRRNVPLLERQIRGHRIHCVCCNLTCTADLHFTHALKVHGVFTCTTCLVYFKKIRELQVHLHRQHRIPSQVFSSRKEYLERGGVNSVVCCIQCNAVFDLVQPTDHKLFILHSNSCSKEQSSVAVIEDSSSVVESGGGGIVGVSPALRNRDYACKFCGEPFSASKRAAHLRACNARTASLSSASGLRHENGKGEEFGEDKGLIAPPLLHLELPRVAENFQRRKKLMPELNPVPRVAKAPNLSAPPLQILKCSVVNLDTRRSSPVVPLKKLLPQGQNRVGRPAHRKKGIHKLKNDSFGRLYEEPVIGEQYQKLDPLLIEQDPEKRVLMLISELGEIASPGWPSSDMPGYTPKPSDLNGDEVLELTIRKPLEDMTDYELICEMIGLATLCCSYCRQVKLIKIDKRQLGVHLLTRHNWVVKLSEPLKETCKDEAEGSNLLTPKKEEDKLEEKEDLKLEEKEDLKLEEKEDLKLEEPSASAIVEGIGTLCTPLSSCDPSELLTFKDSEGERNGGSVSSKLEKGPVGDLVRGIEDEKILDSGINSDESMDLGSKVDDVVEDLKPSVVDLPQLPTIKATTSIPPSTSVQNFIPVELKEFKIALFKKIFLSQNVVFSYENAKECHTFGEAPCECLLCGSCIDSQSNLFPHWRKIHKGVAMKCAMCQGRFLFAGALFSHLCLGTPNPVIKGEIDRGNTVALAGGKHPPNAIADSTGLGGSELAVDLKEEDCSADTIVLRYQCGFCKNLQLPGFFNYMVHLRREHNCCELCLERLSSQRELEHHMKKHKLNHFCWKCGVTYCAKPNFMTHLFWKHGSESKDCSYCLKKKWPHIYHFCIPPPNFICDTCGFIFTKPKCLVVHKRLHTGQKLKKCTKHNCTETFISKKLLARHLDTYHNPNNPLLPPNPPDATPSLPLAIETSTETLLAEETVPDTRLPPELKDEKPEEEDAGQESLPSDTCTLDDKSSPANENTPLTTNTNQESTKLLEHLSPARSEPHSPSCKSDDKEKSVKELLTAESSVLNISEDPMEVQKGSTVADENSIEVDSEGDAEGPKKPFNLAEVQGPNLSEDESESEPASSPNSSKQRRVSEAVAPLSDIKGIIENDEKMEDSEGSGQLNSLNDVMTTVSNHKDNNSLITSKISATGEVLSATGSELCPPFQAPSVVSPTIPKIPNAISLVANDLGLSENSSESDHENSDSESEANTTKSKSEMEVDTDHIKEEGGSGSKPKETGGKTAVTSILDQCETLEKNLNQSAMDVDDGVLSKPVVAVEPCPQNKVTSLPLPSTPDILLDEVDKLTKHHEDFGSMSPLLPPLDDFNFNVPDIPTFEDNTLPDHIIRENAIFSVQHEHDYCLRHAVKRRPSSPTYPLSMTTPTSHHSPARYAGSQSASLKKSELKVKKLKIIKPKKSKKSKKSHSSSHSRKRHRSSSSSSSSSSSCSSCGTNCSCSSSSSSSSTSVDSSSDNEDKTAAVNPRLSVLQRQPYSVAYNPALNTPPVKRGRGRPKGSVNRNKDGIPTAKKKQPGGAGKRIGKIVVPKLPKVSSSDKPKRKYRKTKGKTGKKVGDNGEVLLGSGTESGLRSDFPEENYILETDLETDDSGSEEAYEKKQLTEVIGRVPPVDEIWNMTSEKYLLKLVRGVKELEELAPVFPPFQPSRERNSIFSSMDTYSVKNSGGLAASRLKLRNVPIKPLIFKRNVLMEAHNQLAAPKPSIVHQGLLSQQPNSRSQIHQFHVTQRPDNKVRQLSLPFPGEVVQHPVAKLQPPSLIIKHQRIHSSLMTGNNPQPAFNKITIKGLPLSPLPLSNLTSLMKPEELKGETPMSAKIPALIPVPSGVRRPRMKIGTGRGGRKEGAAVPYPTQTLTIINHVEETPVPVSDVGGKTNEPLYCICQSPHDNISQMIGCDDKDCEFQWFHFECVGVKVGGIPKGKWYCPDCKHRRKNKAQTDKKKRDKVDDAVTASLIGLTTTTMDY